MPPPPWLPLQPIAAQTLTADLLVCRGSITTLVC